MLEILFKIKGFATLEYINKQDICILTIKRKAKPRCPKCNKIAIMNGLFSRVVKAGRYLTKELKINLIGHKLICKKCLFNGNEQFDFVGKNQQILNIVKDSIPAFTAEMTVSKTAKLLALNKNTVYQLDKEVLEKLPKPPTSIKSLGVDEVAIKKGHNYATIFYDLEKSNVVEVIENRTTDSFIKGIESIGKQQNLKSINAVCSDFWKPFLFGIKYKLPHAKIIYDRFHLVRIMNRYIEEERRSYQKSLNKIDRLDIKQNIRWLLLKRQQNLTDKQQSTLSDLKELNMPLYTLYLLKESFLSIYDIGVEISEVKRRLKSWINDLGLTTFTKLKRFGKTLSKRFKGIVNWHRHRISNGKAEAINNKIQLLKREAFGYRDFPYLRLKILQKCGNLMENYPLKFI